MRSVHGVGLVGGFVLGICALADARAEALRPVLKEWEGKSANAIAKELNAREIKTPTGRPWHAMTVIRVQRRLAGGA